jgi:hypothetical protein
MTKLPDDTSIEPPRLPPFHPDRLLECQDALAGAITKVIDDAEATGWTLAEITVAIADLADNVMLKEIDLEETNYYLKDLLARKS